MLDACADSEEADRELTGDMLCRSGVRPTDVLVLVSSNAGLLVELYRRGFAHVCLAVAPCPCMVQTADVLWLPRACEPSTDGRLPGFLNVLRDGGTLVLHGNASASCWQGGSLRRLLQAEGFKAVEQVVEAGRFCLVARSLGRNHAQARYGPTCELATSQGSSLTSPGQVPAVPVAIPTGPAPRLSAAALGGVLEGLLDDPARIGRR